MITLHPSAPSIPSPVSHRERSAVPKVGSNIDQRRVVTTLRRIEAHESNARAVPDSLIGGLSVDDHPGATDRSP